MTMMSAGLLGLAGIVGPFIFAWMAWQWCSNALEAHKNWKSENCKDHPVAKSIIGSVIAWKVMDVMHQRQVTGGSDTGDAQGGRSVVEDLGNGMF